MTNEEKAREIGEFFDTPYLAALEMAEWKDDQFRKYLEQFISRCEMTARTVVAYDMYGAEVNETYAECARKIINEFFPQDTNVDTSDNDE